MIENIEVNTGYEDGWDAHRDALHRDRKVANEMGTVNSLFRQMNPKGTEEYRRNWFRGWLDSRRQSMGF